jgi:hypothetical protein
MLSVDYCRNEVEVFYTQHAVGNTSADAFCAWWLYRRWKVEPLLAVARAPGGSDDFGLDGFHLENRIGGEAPILHLIQAKYYGSIQAVRDAVKGFARAIEPLALLLEGTALPNSKTNPVLERLQATLQEARDTMGVRAEQIPLRFEILHLCAGAPETIDKTIQAAREQFDERRNDLLPSFEVGLRPIFPPDELDAEHVDPQKKPFPLRFAGEVVVDAENVKFYAGFGYLSDLVKMYDEVGDALFAKNVRSYLFKAHEKGPARYMRDSLRKACVRTNGKLAESPERFAMLHNGISIAATHAQLAAPKLVLREPNIVNGCQTVKNAALWFAERRNKPNMDDDAWERVRIPLRILVTRDEALVRDVTVSNNRQNAIKASAFRANDPLQLELAERFRTEMHIYYERQDEAFKNLKKSNPRFVEENYAHSFEKPLLIEHLAVAIATASLKPALSVAAKPSDLFEDPVYSNVFAPRNLKDLRWLVFLRNLLVVLPLALKDLKEKDSLLNTMATGRFVFPAMRVLSRYIAVHHRGMSDEYGLLVFGSFGKNHHFRKEVRVLMRAQNSGLQQLLKEYWWDAERDQWKSATDAESTALALTALRLHQVDVFGT